MRETYSWWVGYQKFPNGVERYLFRMPPHKHNRFHCPFWQWLRCQN